MLFILFNFLLAGIPCFAVMYFLLRKNRTRNEPSSLPLPAFLVGFLAVLPALIVELSLAPYESLLGGPLRDFLKAFFFVALVEEGSKFLAVRIFFYKRKDFRGISDGVALAVAAGMGFAFFENLFFSFSGPMIFLLRGLTSVPLHAAASGILGYYIGLTKFSYKPLLGRGLLLAVGLHGFYDFLLFLDSWLSFFTLPVILLAVGTALRFNKTAWDRDFREGRIQRNLS